MSNTTNNRKLNHHLHRLSRDVSQLVIREQQLLNDELLRMSRLLQEAATGLRQCFMIMGQQLEHQSALLKQCNQAVPEERRRDHNMEQMLLATSEIGAYIGRAVRALQFEDIIQQLLSHSRRRAEEIEKMFSTIQGRINDLDDYDSRSAEKILAVLKACHQEISNVQDALTLANPVKQQSLEKGDVTLF